jgi:flagellar FliL protein
MAENNAQGGKSKGKLFLIIGLLVVLLAGGAGGYFFLIKKQEAHEEEVQEEEAHDQKPARKAAAHKKKKGAEEEKTYSSLDPPFIVNLRGESRERLLRTSITVLTAGKEVGEALEKHKPMIRNHVLLILAAQDPAGLLTAEGKTKVKAALLEELNKAQEELTGDDKGIEDLFFTDFVMQ